MGQADPPGDDDPTAWFEELYRGADSRDAIPWADGQPNPHLVEWLAETEPDTAGRTLVVGCGLGEDAVELARRGHDVTAFDVSPSAIDWCRERYPAASVRFRVADLFDPPAAWTGAFDLVVEVYTLQALPSTHRNRALAAIASFVAPAGTLLVICRGRDPDQSVQGPPWPLTRDELTDGDTHDLDLVTFEDYTDPDSPTIRRFRATFERPAP